MEGKQLVADTLLVAVAGDGDEIANPLRAITLPPQKYPLVSQLRGVAGHLVGGPRVAALVEAGWKTTGRR